MRLVDWTLRQGHLDEAALTEAVLAGERPRHVDSCDRCAERMLAIGRWLADVKAVATADVDAAFPAERLAAQQAQILRRLEQADEPARVLEFPLPTARAVREPGGRRVAAAWVGVAAAAGLVVGVFGGQFAARHAQPAAPQTAVAQPARTNGSIMPASLSDTDDLAARPTDRTNDTSVLELDLDGFTPNSLRAFDEATPRLTPSSYTVAVR